MSNHEIPTKVLDLLKSKFNIVEHVSFVEFDHDFDILTSRFLALKKDVYSESDRIIVEHFDTDFYYPESTVGVNLRNFFTVANMIDIPLYLFVFYTNHFGIQREIDIICQHAHPKDRPLVLESFISKLHYPEHHYIDTPLAVDAITCPALCMISGQRSQRHALFNAIKHIDRNQIAINYTPLL